MGTWAVSVEQCVVAYRLFELVGGQLRRTPADLAGVGRGPSVLLSILDVLQFKHLPQHVSDKSISELISTQARPLYVTDASLPDRAGVLDLGSVLKEAVA